MVGTKITLISLIREYKNSLESVILLDSIISILNNGIHELDYPDEVINSPDYLTAMLSSETFYLELNELVNKKANFYAIEHIVIKKEVYINLTLKILYVIADVLNATQLSIKNLKNIFGVYYGENYLLPEKVN